MFSYFTDSRSIITLSIARPLSSMLMAMKNLGLQQRTSPLAAEDVVND
jgi:hypothetical protein